MTAPIPTAVATPLAPPASPVPPAAAPPVVNGTSGASTTTGNGCAGIDRGVPPTAADTDGDGLTDDLEKLAGTNRESAGAATGRRLGTPPDNDGDIDRGPDLGDHARLESQ